MTTMILSNPCSPSPVLPPVLTSNRAQHKLSYRLPFSSISSRLNSFPILHEPHPMLLHKSQKSLPTLYSMVPVMVFQVAFKTLSQLGGHVVWIHGKHFPGVFCFAIYTVTQCCRRIITTWTAIIQRAFLSASAEPFNLQAADWTEGQATPFLVDQDPRASKRDRVERNMLRGKELCETTSLYMRFEWQNYVADLKRDLKELLKSTCS